MEAKYLQLFEGKPTEELCKKVFENRFLFPSVQSYKTLEQIEKRKAAALGLIKSSTTISKKRRHTNEYLTLVGKALVVGVQKTGAYGALLGGMIEVQYIDVAKGSKKSAQDKIDKQKQIAEEIATYYRIGAELVKLKKESEKAVQKAV